MPISDPRQPAYDAVFGFIRENRPRTDDGYEAACQNARVWQAVEVALDAMSVPKVSPSELYPRRDRRACVNLGDQEHDHAMCEDVVAEQGNRPCGRIGCGRIGCCVPAHAFVRHPDPKFGAALGGGCGSRHGGVICGWPASAHALSATRPQPTESGTFTGPNGEQHVVTFTDAGTEIDWECSCKLIAGHPNLTREDAAWDVIQVHSQQGEPVTAPSLADGGDR